MPHQPYTTTLQNVARGLLGSFMVVAGTGHLTFARQDFQAQVPDFVPLEKDTVVLASGVVEIGLGVALLLLKGKNRVRMGLGLAAFYAAVFPATCTSTPTTSPPLASTLITSGWPGCFSSPC